MTARVNKTTKHPLIGKFLAEADLKNKLVNLRRFDADLGHGLMLCTWICAINGDPKGQQCIVHLADLSGTIEGYNFEIFKSFREFSQRYDVTDNGDKGNASNILYFN